MAPFDPASGEGRERPFLLSGDRATLVGLPSGGVEEISLPPFTVVRDLRVSLPTPDRVEVAPGAARRRRAWNGATADESLLVLHRLPGAVLQWAWKDGARGPFEASPSGGQEPPRHLNVDWRIPRGGRVDLPDTATAPLVIRWPNRAATVLVHARGPNVTGQDGSWKRNRRIGLHTTLERDVSLTLLFVLHTGEGMEAAAATRRLSSLDAEMTARASADVRASETELDLAVEDARTTAAFRWARRRLHGALVHPGGRRPGVLRQGSAQPDDRSLTATAAHRARTGSGLLALGRHDDAGEVVARAVEILLGVYVDGGAVGGSGDGPQGPAHVAELFGLIGRFVLWTGDSGPLHRLGDRLERWFEILPNAEQGSGRGAHSPLAECAEAVEAAGDRARARHLRELLAPEDPEAVAASGGIDAAFDGGSVEWTRRIRKRLDVDGSGSPDLSSLAETGDLVAWLLFDLLGARGDGFYGRLRLAPRIPRQWHRFTVGGIRMADSRVRLSYHAAGRRHTFRLEPTGGRVPLNLVFEPLLPAPILGDAWVDGDPAEVDRYRLRGRVGARLQLALDDSRVVVLAEDGGGRADPHGDEE